MAELTSEQDAAVMAFVEAREAHAKAVEAEDRARREATECMNRKSETFRRLQAAEDALCKALGVSREAK